MTVPAEIDPGGTFAQQEPPGRLDIGKAKIGDSPSLQPGAQEMALMADGERPQSPDRQPLGPRLLRHQRVDPFLIGPLNLRRPVQAHPDGGLELGLQEGDQPVPRRSCKRKVSAWSSA